MTRSPETENSWKRLHDALTAAAGSASVAEHARIQREVSALVAKNELPQHVRPLKIACLRGVTLEPLAPTIVASMAERDFAATVQFGQLGNYVEEILSPDSFLYRDGFDVCVLLAPIESVLPQADNPGASFNDLPQSMQLFLDCLDTLAARFAGLIIVCNFWHPEHALARRFQTQFHAGFRYAVDRANELLASRLATHKHVAVSDTAYLVHQIGASHFLSERNMAIAMQPFSPVGFQSLCRDWAGLCQLHFRGAPKCIVLDCDGTLWGGIIGEDGLEGIRLGETYPGTCYQRFQQQLKRLKDLGFLLAINSKNNEADVAAVFQQHPGMALRLEDFSCIRINWQDKAANIRSIAEELNLGVDSFVFIDDNPFELEMVRASAPGVACLRVPEEIWRLPHLLPEWGQLDRLRLTREDLEKSAMYAQERQRKTIERGTASQDDYLRELQLQMTVERFDSERHLERAVQLLQKTNQFNLTTRRHSSNDISALIASGATVYLASLKDRFGDYGRIALAILTFDGDGPMLETFLMSCRAIGRKAEVAFLGVLVKKLQRLGHRTLRAQFIPTAKNQVCASFLPDQGFQLLEDAGAAGTTYELELNRFCDAAEQFYQVSVADDAV